MRGLCSQEPPALPSHRSCHSHGSGRVSGTCTGALHVRLPTRVPWHLSSHGSPTLHSSEQLLILVLSQTSCKALADPGCCSSHLDVQTRAIELESNGNIIFSSVLPTSCKNIYLSKQEKEKRRQHHGKSRVFPPTARLGSAELPKPPLPPDGIPYNNHPGHAGGEEHRCCGTTSLGHASPFLSSQECGATRRGRRLGGGLRRWSQAPLQTCWLGPSDWSPSQRETPYSPNAPGT